MRTLLGKNVLIKEVLSVALWPSFSSGSSSMTQYVTCYREVFSFWWLQCSFTSHPLLHSLKHTHTYHTSGCMHPLILIYSLSWSTTLTDHETTPTTMQPLVWYVWVCVSEWGSGWEVKLYVHWNHRNEDTFKTGHILCHTGRSCPLITK